MGPSSTGPFVDRVVAHCRAHYGAREDEDFPRMLILSLPTPFHADRPTDHGAMRSALLGGLGELERAGVDVVGIACNTAHVYFDDLVAGVRVPVVSMVKLAVEALPARAQRVAVVGARPTLESGIYLRALEGAGRSVVDLACQSDVDHLLEGIRNGAASAALDETWQRIAERVSSEDVDALVIACADLSALGVGSKSVVPTVDATDCLARALVVRWHRLASQVSLGAP
ncbi:Amino acid racemase RacX [Labilithrix luteola]|uniref:Amino acid racemase RacX n=1 Tax=Labilithrix luteola TaxID=1391654 RepID=A0A0K1QFE5_9BACT|nr:aspartate/glutamate racemase family protein [Labilithrix luteola]AKV04484.1 Amino acid racemase RacX [Labilithrix luteola]